VDDAVPMGMGTVSTAVGTPAAFVWAQVHHAGTIVATGDPT
jgi:hypothetical protein